MFNRSQMEDSFPVPNICGKHDQLSLAAAMLASKLAENAAAESNTHLRSRRACGPAIQGVLDWKFLVYAGSLTSGSWL